VLQHGRASLPLASAYSLPPSDEGRDFISGAALSHHAATNNGVSLGDATPMDWDICWGVDCPDTCVIEFLHGAYCFYQCTFTLWWCSCGVYARILDLAPILDGDEMDFSTRVYTIRCVWAPAVMSYVAR
jgi:hypothetical protein